ncbi:siderophore ABC transporter substrate-binding protein [Lipingzhangella sp. LS1_29]|uniref:Siderophore ABC transporter substrate-binding protein n=1 Tax=Lipingzhangella rawalii TaxID=2055835 RepID=A0ABU2H6W3_9ACTN|nr:siderophore ABC transporter substrate-binding protein [Lipingzhangella rawalii]MDS1271043.1 siderophore ABC transporter substrate-binding protein [Lipingzhangella rawalii]
MSPRSLAVCSLLPVSALVLAGCSADAADDNADGGTTETVTVQAENGEIEVPQTPETVVVFDNTQLDILDALDIEVAGIPSADAVPAFFSDYADNDAVANVGSLFDPDFEAVAELDPDLVISGGRSSDATGELAEIAPTIDMSTETGNTLGSLADRALAYGEIFDRTGEAEQLVTELEERTADLGEQVAEAGDGLVVITSSGEISAYGPGSRYGYFYDDLGLEPAVEVSSEEASHGEVLSFEALAEADPDWLYVIDRDTAIGEDGASPAEQVLDNDLVASTTAAQEDQILYLNSEEVYLVGGIQAHLNTLDDIDAALS